MNGGRYRTGAVSDAIEADVRSETEGIGPLAAFTRLSRRVTRPGVLSPGPGCRGIPEPVFNGLTSKTSAVMLKLLRKARWKGANVQRVG